MNREILFRGKSVINNKWVEGYYYKSKMLQHEAKLYDFIAIPHPEIEDRGNDNYMIFPETLGQYTGLVDKNGMKIFEGDILKDDWGKIYKVIFTLKSCSFMVECMITPNEYETGRYRIGEVWCKTIEVIGNIHDNPELLEAE